MQKGVVAVFKQKNESHEHRCLCGSLLARITPEGIELKCRKWVVEGRPALADRAAVLGLLPLVVSKSFLPGNFGISAFHL